MSSLELLRLFEQFEGEVSMSDFTVEELEELLYAQNGGIATDKEKYFEKYNDVKSPSLDKQDW